MKKLILLSLILNSCFLYSEVITWQGPQGFMSDKYYKVKVNGVDVPVYDTPIASYAVFDFTGNVTVEVNTMYDVRWVDVRPLRTAIKPEYSGNNSFRFDMSKPENLSVELNGRIRQQPLFIFSGNPEKEKPSKTDPNVIWFEGGKLYKDVKLELQDNQTVYIEGGAVVQGYIFAEGKKNTKICGRGILDGTYNKKTEGNNNRFISFTDGENISINDIILHNGTTWQTKLIHCQNAQINGIRIVSESGSDDGMDIVRSKNVLIDGVFAHTKDDCVAIKSHLDYPTDDNTDNILVKNCTFWNSIWGNAIEIGFELYSNEVKNIRFENIDIIHVEDGAAMSIHNAGNALVHNVSFENIRIEDCRQKLIDLALIFSQYSPDYPYILPNGKRDRELYLKNYLHGAWDGVVKILEGKEKYHSQFRGLIWNVSFKNIHVVGGLMPFSVFHGYDQVKNVSDITVKNLTYNGKKIRNLNDAKFRLQNTMNLKLK